MKNRIEFKKDKIPFTQVANGVLHSSSLSFKAKGLYAYLYSKPDGWDFALDRIVLETSDGRDSVYSAILELEINGYLSREKQSDGRTVYVIHFPPMLIGSYPVAENPELAQGASCGKSHIGKIRSISNNDLKVIKRETRLASPKRGKVSKASKGGGMLKGHMSKIRGYNENFPHDDEPSIDADTGEVPARQQRPTRNVIAERVSRHFFNEARKYTSKPLVNTGYAWVGKLMKQNIDLSEEFLISVIDAYFERAPSDKDAGNIFKCLSSAAINEHLTTYE